MNKILLSICTLFMFNIQAQSLLKEFTMPESKIENIQAFSTAENIYLFYEYAIKSGITKKAYQIRSDGTCQELFLQPLEALLIGVRDEGDSVLFYYLSEEKKAITLSAVVYSLRTRESAWQKEKFRIDGHIIGVSNDDLLSFATYNKEFNQLRILQFDRLKQIEDKSFKLSVDLSNDYRYLSFIQDDSWTSTAQAASKFKLYKKDEKFIMSIDYTFYENNYTRPQTVVLTFNTTNGTQSFKKFEKRLKNTFRSFIHNDMLYRTVTSGTLLQLEILNISTGELIEKRTINSDAASKKSVVYIRNGKTYTISKTETLHKMISTSNASKPSVIVLPKNDSGETIVVWGTYYPDDNGIFISPVSPLGLLASAMGSAIVQMKKPTTLSRYFYIDINGKNESSDHALTSSKRQIIDDYEVSLNNQRIFFAYKTYFSFQNKSMGLYYSERALTLKLVMFN